MYKKIASGCRLLKMRNPPHINVSERGINNMDLSRIRDIARKTFFENRDYSINQVTSVAVPPDVPSFIKKDFFEAIDYNISGGKCTRGMSVVENFIIFLPRFSEVQLKQAALFGWVIEIFQALFLILDDVMDESELRRGRTCWYKTGKVGLRAINDALCMETSSYLLIRNIFGSHPSALKLIDLALSICQKTTIGQSIDMTLCQFGQSRPCNFTDFTLDTYEKLVFYKTSCYSFIFPFMTAYHLAELDLGEKYLDLSWNILKHVGLIFQVQDDYLDVYGDPVVMGKIGTDIQDGKCSWLTARLLTVISDSDKAILSETYGRKDPACIEEVRKLYLKYGIPNLYEDFINKEIKSTITLIEETFKSPLSTYYISYLEAIRNRKK